MQEYIESSKGRDVRIHIVGDKIVTAMERVNEDDFRANITNGGKMKKYTPTEEQCEMALKVCRELKLDFAEWTLCLESRVNLYCAKLILMHILRTYMTARE